MSPGARSATPPGRWLYAVLLGLAAAWLNGAYQPALLDEASPLFSFGWIFSYFAYLRFGQGPGLLAAGLGAAGGTIRIFLLFNDPGIALSGLIYVVESWVVWRLSLRNGSLVLSALLFWIGPGWILDIGWYNGVNGLPLPYVAQMFIKQVFNSTACTVGATLLDLALPTRWAPRPTPPETLRRFVLSRLILVVTPLAALLGLLYTRTGLQEATNQALLRQQSTAGRLAVSVRSYLQERESEIGGVTERIQVLRALGDSAGAVRAVREFHGKHPEFINVGIADSSGVVTASSPDTTASGEKFPVRNISQRSYFSQIRTDSRPVWAPIILGTLRLRNPDGLEPIMVIARRLSDAEGRFTGGLFAALDVTYLTPILTAAAENPSQELTLLDGERSVIAALGHQLASGQSLRETVPDSLFRGGEGGVFSYYPAPDSTRLSVLGLNLRHAAYQSVAEPGWGVLVGISAVTLHRTMLPTVARVLLLIVITPLLLFAVVRLGGDRVSSPLALVSRTAGDIAEGRSGDAEPLAPLLDSNIVEIRDLGLRFVGMGHALAARYAHEELRAAESEHRFQIAFENPFVGVQHFDAGGRTIRVNDRLCEMLGYSREELLKLPLLPQVPADRRDEVSAQVREVLGGGQAARVLEFPVHRKDGAEILVRWTITAIRNPDGTLTYGVMMGEDVTARRSLEQQLLQAQKIEAIGLLAGGVAHDFNNLLTPILGFTEMALHQLPEGSPIRSDLEQVRDSSERARDLTRQLLAFGRKQNLEMRVLKLGEVIEQFRRLLRPIVRENIRIDTSAVANLAMVRADPTQVQQVLMNLSLNGIDAMPGGGTLTIEAKNVAVTDPEAAEALGISPGDYVALLVRDSGQGISADVRQHIFEPFFSTKELGKGTGLGLATVHGIVLQHQGAIQVDSEPGSGTLFTIYLPARSGLEAEETPAAPAPTPAGPRVPGVETILVVEDDPAVRGLITSILDRNGYQVLEADSAEAALELLDGFRGRLPLLCTDVIMPGMTGRELYVRLRARYPDLRALFVSGYPGDPTNVGGLPIEAGTAFIQKPFSADALIGQIRELFGDRR